jgi:hypothetical protein
MSLIQWGLHAKLEMVKNWGFAAITHLYIFFQLQHVGGQLRHENYQGKTKTSLIESSVMCICLPLIDAPPSSLDSNLSPNSKQRKSKELGHAP